jgi:hypothetical protein
MRTQSGKSTQKKQSFASQVFQKPLDISRNYDCSPPVIHKRSVALHLRSNSSYARIRTKSATGSEVHGLPTLKDKVNEFAEIAKALPENLQVVCFELLLRSHLDRTRDQNPKEPTPSADAAKQEQVDKPLAVPSPDTSKQQDFKLSDLHVKARHFLGRYTLGVEQINNLFFKENTEVKPLYDDLKTTKTSESQIRVALLLALKKAMTTGDFVAETSAVRDECNERKCYDVKNFGNNFNNRNALFDFDKFTKETASVRLAEPGKSALAEVIKDLQ